MSTLNSVDNQSHFYCPHFQNVDEKTLNQLFSKVAAVRADDQDLFDFTHRPIKVFHQSGNTEQVVDEEEIYHEFSPNQVGNFTVVIEGEVGTGKSELCAYLAHRLRDEGRPIIHVKKDDDLMTLLSERIPEFYEEQFGEELPGASNFKQLRHDLQENGSVVANNATSGAILNLSARGYSIDASGKEEKIREYVQDQLSLLVEKGEYAKEIKFVTEEAYKRNDFLQVITNDIDVTEAVSAFNEELWRQVRERYQTASLNEVLKRVGDRSDDTRPVMIFEDFAITAMEAKKLSEYMEEIETSGNWDFVVAGTRDSTRVLHTQTGGDRFEYYRTNKQNSNSVLFLDKDSAVDFIRPYLGYFKSFDDSVHYDRSGDALELELQAAPSGSICAQCGFCDESFRDLFPFNEAFLKRIYTGLPEDEQSPREYVMAVFDVLRDYYEGYVDRPSDADRLLSLENSVSASTEIYEDVEPLAHLARWYGSPTDDGISIDSRFVEAFGFRDIVESRDDVKQTGQNVVVPTDLSGIPSEGTDTNGGSGTGTGGNGGGTSPGLTRAEQLVQDHRSNVQTWQQNPADFDEITRYLRTGLRDAIDRLTDDFTLYDGMSLRYNLSSEKDPFVFKSLAQAPDDDQIVIDPAEFRISDLRKLLKFGIYREVQKGGADYEELLRDLGTQLTGYARRWRQQVREQNLQSEMRLFKKSADYAFEDFALAGYTYAVLLDSPTEELSAELLSRRFDSGTSYTLDDDLRSELKSELPTDDFDAITEFVANAEWYREMVNAFFGANESTLDVAAIRARLEANPPYQVLEGLGRGRIGRISPRVRFDTDSKIRDIADNAYDLHRAFESIEGEYRDDVVTTITDELAGVSIEKTESLVDTLRTYDSIDAEMIESLGKFVALSQRNLNTAVDAAKLADDLVMGTDAERLQGTLISLKLTSTNAYQRYDDLTIVGGGRTGGDFAKQFRTVGEHYVE
ncbi:ATP-binding protein [Halarchaeum salinum]|uniref:AAA family ATPase n=1 Tax=Halarchaeum salinum TaxID=489912 RepID=A0AAV3S905_9EURY